jgi:hypothetical protein
MAVIDRLALPRLAMVVGQTKVNAGTDRGCVGDGSVIDQKADLLWMECVLWHPGVITRALVLAPRTRRVIVRGNAGRTMSDHALSFACQYGTGTKGATLLG